MKYAYAYQLNGSQTSGLDPDARAYILAVEAADGQALEAGVRSAYNTFVKGCKSDGIWNAIKSSCILSGARTLSGALVPLRGNAPTNFNFVSGDYNRKTGLIGNGSTKYLNSNRNNNADPQDSRHVSIYASTISTGTTPAYFGGDAVSGSTQFLDTIATTRIGYRLSSSTAVTTSIAPSIGFIGVNRPSSSTTALRNAGTTTSASNNSATPTSFNLLIYRRTNTTGVDYANARMAFYSIGEAVDLAKLDSRVKTLVSNIASAIP
jgi:hypothetical protein